MPRRKVSHGRAKRYMPYPMTDVDAPGLDDFIASGRTGRRNALPDILDEKHAATDTSTLPLELSKLQCRDDDEASKSDTACADPQQKEPVEETKKEETKS